MSQSLKARLAVMLMMAIMGAAFFFGFVSEDMANATDLQVTDVPRSLIIRYIVAMAVGGGIAGAVVAGLFGRSSVTGWALALLGAVLATLLGGLIGSAVGQIPDMMGNGFNMTEMISIGFGLVVIPLSMAGQPGMIAVWVALMILAHLWSRRIRRKG